MKSFALPCLVAVLGLLPATLAAGRANPVVLDEVQRDGIIDIYAENGDTLAPWHLTLQFPKINNFKADTSLPVRAVLQPGERRKLVTLSVMNPRRSAGYRSDLEAALGDPTAKPDLTHVYLLPWAHGKKHQVVQGYFGAFTHRGSRSLDFDLKEGEPIHAARAGVVTFVKEDSNVGGVSGRYADKANVVEIFHDDGTWARYAHLKYRGVLVRVGQKVQAGQRIGLAGDTGQARGPHLHFTVHRAGWKDEETVATRFLGPGGKPVVLKENEFIYARHPGGRDFEETFASDRGRDEMLRYSKKIAYTGKVDFRQEREDDRDFIYCRNGTRQTQEVKFNLRTAVNASSTEPLPVTREVPPLTEVWLSTILLKGAARYQSSFSSRAKR